MRDDRLRIDPGNQYPADGLRLVESLAIRVLDCLPNAEVSRTRDAIQIETGEEEGVVVLVTAEAVEMRLPRVEWTCGAYGPAPSSRLWKRVKAEKIHDGEIDLLDLLCKAQSARRREFRKCRYCKKLIPAEHRHGNVCHGCAERYMGCVH
jgi:hypothetical protein